jgi:hypothetical protein
MESIDYTQKQEFTIFIPTHRIQQEEDTDIGRWKSINEGRHNWMKDAGWIDLVNTFIKLSDELVYVLFNDTYTGTRSGISYHESALYKGILK